jgi:hypothetical protein
MSVSSASETIGTQLTETTSFFTTSPKEFFQCISFNIKMIFTLSFTVLLLCLFMSCINAFFPPFDRSTIRYDPAKLITRGFIFENKVDDDDDYIKRNIEMFSNDEIYSYQTAQESSYQSIPLLAPNDENLFFGQAKRFISSIDGKLIYRLEIYANLFVLDGNIYDKVPRNSIKQKYIVTLQNTKTQDLFIIGDLVKDGDGIYKLKFISNEKVQEFVKFDKVNISYKIDNDTQLLLSGTFN